MATKSESTAKRTRAKGGSQSKRRQPGKAQAPKAKSRGNGRARYPENFVAIASRARKLATPKTEQGPVAKQVADVQRVLTEGPRESIKSVGLTQAQVKAIATGKADRAQVRQLRPLAERVIAAGGAKQWVSGRSLAATLTAWMEQ